MAKSKIIREPEERLSLFCEQLRAVSDPYLTNQQCVSAIEGATSQWSCKSSNVRHPAAELSGAFDPQRFQYSSCKVERATKLVHLPCNSASVQVVRQQKILEGWTYANTCIWILSRGRRGRGLPDR